MPPFCAAKCPARGGNIFRWHRSCFRCPYRAILQYSKKAKNYAFAADVGRWLPRKLSLNFIFFKEGSIMVLFNNQSKLFSKERDILLNPFIWLAENTANTKIRKIWVQICEEIAK